MRQTFGTVIIKRYQRREGKSTDVYRDGTELKHRWAGGVKNASVFVVIGVEVDDYRQILVVQREL